MTTKKKGHAQAVKEPLEAVARASPPATEGEATRAKPSETPAEGGMVGRETPAGEPPAPVTAQAPEQALVPASNAFDTAPSKDRLHQLEDEFRKKLAAACATAAEAIGIILKIRDERQYVADGYQTFDEYMEDRWNHTRQWVEQNEKHLK